MPTEPPRGVPPLPAIAEVIRTFTPAFLLVLAGLAGLFVAVPGARTWLVREGGLTEGLTTATLAAATVLGIWGIRRTPSAPRSYWLVPAAGLLGILDETGLGAGLVGYDRLRVGDITIDSLGDLLRVVGHYATSTLGLRPLDLLAIGGSAVALGAIYAARRGRASRALSWLASHPPSALLIGAVGVGMLAAGLDLADAPRRIMFTGEMLELGGAGLLAAGALLIPRPQPSLQGWRPRMAAWANDRRDRPAVPDRDSS